MNKPISFSNLQEITLVDQVVVISMTQAWQQEDTLPIGKAVLGCLPKSKIVEINEGADRLDIRIDYKNTLFVMRFDITSQSCWIEIEQGVSSNEIMEVYKTLQNGMHFKSE